MISRLGSYNNNNISKRRTMTRVILSRPNNNDNNRHIAKRWLSVLMLLEPRVLQSVAGSAWLPNHPTVSRSFSSSHVRSSFGSSSSVHPQSKHNLSSSQPRPLTGSSNPFLTKILPFSRPMSSSSSSNEDGGSNKRMKQDALKIIHKSIQAVDPYASVDSHVECKNDILQIGDVNYSLPDYEKIVLVAFGKASSAMATAVVQQLSNASTQPSTMGICICKDDHATPEEFSTLEQFGIKVLEASHPVPDQRSSEAAQQALEMVQQEASSDKTLVLCCISGGGSALFCRPQVGLTLENLQETNQALLASGMSIQDCNVIRKRLEQGKGGRLALACHPAQLVTLVLSDVLGDPLDLIASGPTVPDTSTPQDAMQIVQRYQLQDKLPKPVMSLLEEQVASQDANDTPSPNHPIFQQAQTVLVGNNALAVQAAAQEAKKLGYHPVVLGTQIEGEAKEIAKMYTRMALHLQESTANDEFSVAPALPAALIAGGETTVSLFDSGKIGKGGRNQELALSAALELQSLQLDQVVLASAGTDGTDGPTDAAGAMVDAHTIQEETLEGARNALTNHDAYPFLDALGNEHESEEDRPLIKTGPTGTNVADVCVTLIR